LGTYRLISHPDTPPKGIDGVEVRWFEAGGKLILRYQVKGVDALSVPAFAGKGRGDDLWQTTCGELFLKDAQGQGYTEFNFSPSERWAAYRFSGYRADRSDAALPIAPEISASAGEYLFMLTATIDAALLTGATLAGLSAVIAEKDGTRSYWALAHPPQGDPDFHDPACFALPLPAAG
jgi:hypothetical protein